MRVCGGALLTVMKYADGLEVSVRDGVVVGSRRGG
jgi:hypothetical protein